MIQHTPTGFTQNVFSASHRPSHCLPHTDFTWAVFLCRIMAVQAYFTTSFCFFNESVCKSSEAANQLLWYLQSHFALLDSWWWQKWKICQQNTICMFLMNVCSHMRLFRSAGCFFFHILIHQYSDIFLMFFICPKWQSLIYFDKKNQWKFQAFVFNRLWDQNIASDFNVQQKGLKMAQLGIFQKNLPWKVFDTWS